MPNGEQGAALITGASSGIGAELAKLFARDGHDLVLVARGREELERLGETLRHEHGVSCLALPADLADPAAPAAIEGAVRSAGIEVEVLVNNAGFGLYGPFVGAQGQQQTELARELEMIQVNVTAPTHLAKLFLPAMVARGRGRVMNVASTAAFQPGPMMAVYYATKAYLLSFSEALAVELRGTGVSVTAFCPGPTRTNFQQSAAMGDTRLFASPHVMDAAGAARAGYRGMLKGKALVIPGAVNKLLAQGTRFVPRKAAAHIARIAHDHR